MLDSPISHWDVVLKIMRYLKSAPSRGLLYPDYGHSDIWIFSYWLGRTTIWQAIHYKIVCLLEENIERARSKCFCQGAM